MESHPPVVKTTAPDGKEAFHPTLPEVFGKNTRYFYRMDINRTIKLFLSTIIKETPPRPFSLRVLFNKRQSFFNYPTENNSVEYVEALKPLWDALELTTASSGSGVYNNNVDLNDVLLSRPVSPILFYLIEEAFLILDKILAEHSEKLKAAEGLEDKDEIAKTLRATVQNRISQTLAHIMKIVNGLRTRLMSTCGLENKQNAQKMFETKFYEVLDKFQRYSEKCYSVGSDVVDPASPLDSILNLHIQSFVDSAYRVSASHAFLSLHAWRHYKPLLDHFSAIKSSDVLTATESRLFESLKNFAQKSVRAVPPYSPPTVFEYAKMSPVPTYYGLSDWSTDEIFEAVLSKFEPAKRFDFWLQNATGNFLTSAQKRIIGEKIPLEVMSKLMSEDSYTLSGLLDQFFGDVPVSHARATELLAELKTKDLDGSLRETLTKSLLVRLDITEASVRETLQNGLNVPTIDQRVAAIVMLLQATNKAKSVSETFKTISWLFNRIR
jgi:hypothetical protein